MSGQELAAGTAPSPTEVLDHAAEFVEIVYRQAPVEYQSLLSSDRFRAVLEGDTAFNHGKLYTYAEFTAFRRDFEDRFPEASAAACVNAFAGLFLKNDISIQNLLEYVEGADDERQLRLNGPGNQAS